MKPMPEAKWPPRISIDSAGEYEDVETREERGINFFPPEYTYLSLAEHTHLLSEAVREAKAQVYSEIADQIDMMALYDEVDEMASEYKAKAAELRENGGKNG